MLHPFTERRKASPKSLQTRLVAHLLSDGAPKLVGVLLLDSDPLRWTLSWLGFAFAMGLALADTSAASYTTMLLLAPASAWSVAFSLYGLLNLYSCLTQSPTRLRLFSGSLGLCLWGFTFLSFIRVDPAPISAVGLILIVLAASEVWLYAEVMVKRAKEKGQKCLKA